MARTMHRTSTGIAPAPENGYRSLVAAIFLQALADLRNPTYRAEATFWLSHPAVKDLATWIDFELPDGIAVAIRRRNRERI